MPYADLDGLRLHYERTGSGEPELLFVHGWCCDLTAFGPQFEHFRSTHAVTSLDLRGCGQSDAPEDGYAIEDLADDLAQFCEVVGIEKPVVVGHSLGGMIAVDLGARYPGLPRALVLVDPGPLAPRPETVEFFREFAEQLRAPDGDALRREFVHDMGARDDELARWIVDLMCKPTQPVAAASIRGTFEWDGREPLARCEMPVLLLRDGIDERTDVHRLLEIKPDLEIGITVGAGHFHQLEVPEQVNAMIGRFLALSL
jgi:pimeloyl-ACP methyl ester carboxylesterase